MFRAVTLNRSHLAEWLDTPDRINSEATARSALSDHSVVRFGAFQDGTLRGCAKLILGPPAELGIWVTEDAQGQGVALALGLAALTHATSAGLGPVLYCSDPSNLRSIRLRERLAKRCVSTAVKGRGGEQCWQLSLMG